MKTKIYKLCLILIFLQSINIAICDDSQFELYFRNYTADTVNVKIYPIGMLMNGRQQYNLIARWQLNTFLHTFNYNAGVRVDSGIKKLLIPVTPSGLEGFNYDGSISGAEPPLSALGSFGRGVYKIIFRWGTSGIDSVLFEQDAGENYDIRFILESNTSNYGGPGGVGLTYESLFTNAGWGPEKWIGLSNRYIKCWNPYPYIDTLPRRNKDFGNFLYDEGDTSTLVNPYTIFPLDSRADCDLSQYSDQRQEFVDNGNYLLTLNLTFDKDISTRDTLVVNPTNIVVTKGVHLTINPGYKFNMITASNGPNYLIVEDSSFLSLGSGSQLIVDAGNR